MPTRSHKAGFWSAIAAAVLLLGSSVILGALWPQDARANEAPAGSAGRPLAPVPPVEELAASTSQLQIYGHKLPLSLDAGNKGGARSTSLSRSRRGRDPGEGARVRGYCCNTCHAASQHGFVRIKRNSGNPVYQDFAP